METSLQNGIQFYRNITNALLWRGGSPPFECTKDLIAKTSIYRATRYMHILYNYFYKKVLHLFMALQVLEFCTNNILCSECSSALYNAKVRTEICMLGN